MRRWICLGVSVGVLFLMPQAGWGEGTPARVGARTVGNVEISLYVWGPQELVHPKGEGHATPATPATHHLDVRVYDLRRAIYIPYLNVKATITDKTKQREFTVDLSPMIGEWIHYGANITLPHRGTYSILIDVQPPDIARYKHLADVWNTPAQAVFSYEVR
ncbi:MAG: iron transporter [candidate division NC10 bacterium]|nr:iron transporter [candidate division NC10 bacterium]